MAEINFPHLDVLNRWFCPVCERLFIRRKSDSLGYHCEVERDGLDCNGPLERVVILRLSEPEDE